MSGSPPRVTPIVVIALLAVLLATGKPALAQEPTSTVDPVSGIGLYPAVVDVRDALRGQRYQVGTVLVNGASADRLFTLEPEGDLSSWITFATQSEPEALVSEVTVPASGELPIWVYVNVPDDASNEEYEFGISYKSQPPPGATSGVVLSLVQPVKVSVSGEQILDVELGDIFTLGVEVGQPLRIRARVTNRSNVAVTPTIVLDIATSAGSPIAQDLQGVLEQFRAGDEKEVIAYEWDSSGQQPGDYVMTYSFVAQGEEFGSGELLFALAPFGSLERSGEIVSITFDSAQSVGQVGRADVVFRNTGRTDVRARFLGEMYIDGDLGSQLESREEILATPGRDVTLSVFFDINEAGTYELRGRVNFEGALTDEASASFATAGPADGFDLTAVAFGALAVLAVAAIGALVWWRRRS